MSRTNSQPLVRRWRTPAPADRNAWFPGRFIGGAALVAGPLVWWTGLLLRYLGLHSGAFTAEQLAAFSRQPFAAPSQLAAYLANPALVTAGYACFAAGALLLFPAFVTLARFVARRAPMLACWGGTLVILGLFARLYDAGVDQAAFQLAASQGPGRATDFVLGNYASISYGPWRVAVVASACQYLGTLLLAIGAFRSGTFGTGRCLILLWAGTLWGGVLKAANLPDLFEYGALCLVLVPWGVQVLRDRVADRDVRALRILSW
jgi:hypothetical protein